MLRMAIGNMFLCSIFALGLAKPTAPTNYENLNAVLWMQTAVEYKAATVQTYRVAQAALLQGLRDPHWTAALEQVGDFANLPPAVILDLDETVLDNSTFDARLVVSPVPQNEIGAEWTKWANEVGAGLVPGRDRFFAVRARKRRDADLHYESEVRFIER